MEHADGTASTAKLAQGAGWLYYSGWGTEENRMRQTRYLSGLCLFCECGALFDLCMLCEAHQTFWCQGCHSAVCHVAHVSGSCSAQAKAMFEAAGLDVHTNIQLLQLESLLACPILMLNFGAGTSDRSLPTYRRLPGQTPQEIIPCSASLQRASTQSQSLCPTLQMLMYIALHPEHTLHSCVHCS